ncbi:hypothetical protein Q7P35_004197 [Cladosporium inversicolor]
MAELFGRVETFENFLAMRCRVLPHAMVPDNPQPIDYANKHCYVTPRTTAYNPEHVVHPLNGQILFNNPNIQRNIVPRAATYTSRHIVHPLNGNTFSHNTTDMSQLRRVDNIEDYATMRHRIFGRPAPPAYPQHNDNANKTANIGEFLGRVDDFEDFAAMRRRVPSNAAAPEHPQPPNNATNVTNANNANNANNQNNHNNRRRLTPSESPEPEVRLEVDINPFLQTVKPTTGKKHIARWTREEFLEDAIRAREEDGENERNLTPDSTTWRTEKDTHMINNNKSSGNVPLDSKRRLEVFMFRWGELKDTMLSAVMEDIPGKNESNEEMIRRRLDGHQSRAQCQTLTYLKQSMQHLVEICPEFHDASYPAQRELLLSLFNQAKCTISRNLFGVESQAVDFANMFRGDGGERPKWQKLMKSRFLHLAMATYMHRIIKESKDDDEKVFEIYKNHMSGRAISNMGLDDTGDVPTHSRSSAAAANRANHSKRARIQEVDVVEL